VRKPFFVITLSLIPAAFFVTQEYSAEEQVQTSVAESDINKTAVPDELSFIDKTGTTLQRNQTAEENANSKPTSSNKTSTSLSKNSSQTDKESTTTDTSKETTTSKKVTTSSETTYKQIITAPLEDLQIRTTTTKKETTTTKKTTTIKSPTTSTTQKPVTNQEGRELVFAEEFNTFNPTYWKKENSTYGDGNNELQCYTPNQVNVSGGSLVLTAKKQNTTCPGNKNRQYTSGMVRSQGFTFSPGQSIEYRVKLTPNDEQNQGGLWPAVWASSWAGGGWPRGGEWDGLEVMTANSPKRSVYSIHYSKPNGSHGSKKKEIYSEDNFSANWHTLRFDYGSDGTLVYYLDGKVVNTISDADTIQGWPAPFNSTMTQLKLNMAMGGSPGPIDDRALPATFKIDYLRIYNM